MCVSLLSNPEKGIQMTTTTTATAKALIAEAKVTAKKVIADAIALAKVTKANLPKNMTKSQKAQAVKDAKELIDEAKTDAKVTLSQAMSDAKKLKDVNPIVKGYHFTHIKTPGVFQIKTGSGVLRRIIYHFPVTHNPALIILDGVDSNSVPMDVSKSTVSENPGPGVIPASSFPEEPSSYYVLNYHKAFSTGLYIETKEEMILTVVWE